MTAYSKIFGTVRDTQGVIIPGRSVTVYQTGTLTLASLFEDDDSTSIPNPFISSTDGTYEFNVAAGSYDIAVQVDPFTIIFDRNVPASPTSGGGGGGVSSLNTLTGVLALAAGANITITPSGSTITIAVTAGAGVSSFNTLTGAVTISAGANITLTPSGNNIAISASGGGGGGSAGQQLCSIIDGVFYGGGVAFGAYTIGKKFLPLAAISCKGIQVYWSGVLATLTVSLWDHTGTKLASTTLNVTSTPGLFSVNFGSPVVLTAGQFYFITYSDQVQAQYMGGAASHVPLDAFSPPGYTNLGDWYASGLDQFPVSYDSGLGHCVDPLFS